MKVGLLGFGFMGKMHAQVYKQLSSTTLTAVVDSYPDSAAEALQGLGLAEVPVYSSLPVLLEQADLDIVDVCLPTHMHLEVCLEAIAAGKAIFCEKPLALSAEEANEIATAAKNASIPFQVGHVIRFWPEYQELERLVNAGGLGPLLSLSLQRRAPRPTYATGGWLLDHARSKGALLDLHIHDTDFLIHLLGEPEAVTTWGTKEMAAGWTHVFTRYHYPGIAVMAEGGWNYPAEWEFRMGFDAVFERGAVDFDSTRAPALLLTADGQPAKELYVERPKAGVSRSSAGNIADLGAYFREIEYFVSCVERGEHPRIATAEQSARSVDVVMAELGSAERNETVRLKT